MSQTNVEESISGQQGCGPKAGSCSVFKETGVWRAVRGVGGQIMEGLGEYFEGWFFL